MDYQFLWRPVFKALPELVDAALLTMQVSVVSMIIGLSIGLLLSFGRRSKNILLRWPSTIWVEIARNTPVLFQIFFFYWGLGEFGIFLSSYVAVVTALSFNTAGYMAETFRGGFNAIPNTQLRASRSLGMSFLQTQRYIIIPQVLRVVYYPMTNQFIWVILMSSLGMLAGLRELTGETQFFNSKTFRTFEFFAATAVIYYIIAKLVMIGARLLGWKIFRGQKIR